jgi:F-type H+-transporting ATPase subunit a
MPEHSNWLSLLLEHIKETLSHNANNLGQSFIGGHEASWASFEPLAASLLICLILVLVSASVRSKMVKVDDAIIPDERLTLRTFVEVFLGYFYDLAKSVMDAKRAKEYFPLIGTAACFVFCANVMALVPGMPVATSHLSITLGCALVVFVLFNVYGLVTNGWDYVKHFAGPSPILAPLVFPIELISLCVRPLTLAVRLMLNMAVDHLILGIFGGLIAVFVPVPLMLLGCIVVLVQTLVFTLLTTVYIGMATEHEAHH